MEKLIVTLDQKELTTDLVGGKALNLANLKQAGFQVPHAFVITTAAQGRMDSRLKQAIFEHLKDLETKRFAVRSSATVEDAKLASFAGQFESHLAAAKEGLIEAIEKCWASVRSERVLVYCQHQKIDPEKIKMAVIIQEMIFAEKGGVIFTQDVFQQEPERLVIEAAEGLGGKVVSGLVNPERVMVAKKEKKIIDRQPINGPVLTNKEIKELTKTALKIEALYQFPQDIEWAIMENKIFILQSRPITK